MRATTTRNFEDLNRLVVVTTKPGAGSSGWTSRYAYNTANQRTRRTEGGNSYWVYEYDSLLQVISGKQFWVDGSPAAGRQFEYGCDDIVNRTISEDGGNEVGLGLRNSQHTRKLTNRNLLFHGGTLAWPFRGVIARN